MGCRNAIACFAVIPFASNVDCPTAAEASVQTVFISLKMSAPAVMDVLL